MHAGKTSLANTLVPRGFERLSFAQPVKDISAKMLTVFAREIISPNYPDITIDDKLKGHPAIRKLCQIVGTELGREWTNNPNTWVDRMAARLENSSIHEQFVVDDCRFMNEYKMLLNNGFVFVRVNRNEVDRLESIIGELERTMPNVSVDDRRGKLMEILSHPSEELAEQFEVHFEFLGKSVAHIENFAKGLIGEQHLALVQ